RKRESDEVGRMERQVWWRDGEPHGREADERPPSGARGRFSPRSCLQSHDRCRSGTEISPPGRAALRQRTRRPRAESLLGVGEVESGGRAGAAGGVRTMAYINQLSPEDKTGGHAGP